MKSRRYGALAGIAAAAAAVGVAEGVAILTGATTTPLVAVGGVVVDSVPAEVKNFAVDVFYTYDKLALLIGTLVLLAGFAAVTGVLATRRPAYGFAGIGVFAAVGIAAAATRHNAPWYAFVPTLAGALVAAAVLWWLLRLPVTESGYTFEQRRWFLRAAGGILAAAAVVGFASRWWSTRRGVQAERDAVHLPSVAEPAATLPPDVDAGVPNLAPFVTPNKDFYLIDTALVVPRVSPAEWTLRIHGRVEKELTLSFEELLKRPMIERYITLACVSNDVGGGLVGNARWQGVRIADLLDEVRPKPGADQVVSRSVDGFTAGTPTAALRDGRDAMLAIAMNGEPLPIEHGFPVRMVVPGLYGYVSATKWLAELELTSFADFDAYWIKRGWSQQGPIKTQSRIDAPRPFADLPAGRFTIAGVAWAQRRGISKVEVQIDNDPWQKAELLAVPSIDTWRQWTLAWDATPGTHSISVRATDNGGETQTNSRTPPDPDGATGWHTIEVNVK
ncbi:sulfite oxidase [Dactylosporangium fulvum]|uniref:Molybdopterin-dependent oxidoreductase n=1 Tax=Dactylosporangium fulvum TaxID=53359 RepID=A0ABY5VXV4_9ACTN|nr:molybdopterin-dependent oxidoreductase [Dactylosporangium fulvum]UWP81980.1 molybdopterin-dependent oxidoreductase [Dactylosporangium fulvum]